MGAAKGPVMNEKGHSRNLHGEGSGKGQMLLPYYSLLTALNNDVMLDLG